MKNIIFLVVISLMTMFSTQTLYGQTDTTKVVKFGLGVTLFNIADYITQYSYEPMNNIYMTIDIAGVIRIEPSFSFMKAEENSQYSVGLGVFGVKSYSKLNMLYGIRVATGSSKHINHGYGYNSDYDFDIVAPTIGAEYFLINRFSVGTEIQLRALFIEEKSIFSTYSSVLLRFYF